jgi:hypothetical protein
MRMRTWLPCLIVFLLFFGGSAAYADVVNFDDLTPGAGIPSSYAGFTWEANWSAYSQADYQSNYANTVTFPSLNNTAYNAYGVVTVSLTSGVEFDFNGAYFTSWAGSDAYQDYSARSLTIDGYRGGVLVGSTTASLSPDRFDWVAASLRGVDELRFTQNSGGSQWWLMDNFTYDSAAVPEPITSVMTGAGLLLLAAALRRR